MVVCVCEVRVVGGELSPDISYTRKPVIKQLDIRASLRLVVENLSLPLQGTGRIPGWETKMPYAIKSKRHTQLLTCSPESIFHN